MAAQTSGPERRPRSPVIIAALAQRAQRNLAGSTELQADWRGGSGRTASGGRGIARARGHLPGRRVRQGVESPGVGEHAARSRAGQYPGRRLRPPITGMPRRLLHPRDRAHAHRPSRPGSPCGITGVVEGTAPHTGGRAAIESAHDARSHGSGHRHGEGDAIGELELQEVGVGQGLAGAGTCRAVTQRIGARATARRRVIGGNLEQVTARAPLRIERGLGPVEKARGIRRELAPAYPARRETGIHIDERALDGARMAGLIDRPEEPGAQPTREALPDPRRIGMRDSPGPRRLDRAVHHRLARVQHETGLQREQAGKQHERQRHQSLDRGEPTAAGAARPRTACSPGSHQCPWVRARPPRPPSTSTGPRTPAGTRVAPRAS